MNQCSMLVLPAAALLALLMGGGAAQEGSDAAEDSKPAKVAPANPLAKSRGGRPGRREGGSVQPKPPAIENLRASVPDGGTILLGGQPKSPAIEKLRAEYERLDAEAARAAAEHRRSRAAGDGRRSAGQRDQQKAELRGRVAAAFAARQAWQRAELEQLRAQFARIERQIESRERLEDEIIDRRVEELIDPTLQWAAGEPAAPLPPASSSESQDLQRIQDLEAAADAESSPSRQAELYRQAAAAYEEMYIKHRSQVLGLYARLYQARCLEKLGEDLEARAIYSQLGWTPEEVRTKLPQTDNAMLLPHATAFPQARERLEVAQRRLDVLLDEYRAGKAVSEQIVTAQTDLMEARLSAAQTARERNAALLEHLAVMNSLLRAVQARHKAGQATQPDMLAIQAEVLKAEQRLGRAAAESASKPPGDDDAEPWPTRPALQAYDRETHEKLLRLDLDSATLRLQQAKALLAEAEDARSSAPGIISEAKIRELRLAVELAELEVQRAETLLKAHRGKRGTDDLQFERPDSAAHINEADLAKLAWALLGMKLEPVDRSAVETGPFRGGMAILEILTGGPADKAGLRAGDILVGLHVWETISNDNLAFVLQQEVLREGAAASSGIKALVLRDGDVLSTMLSPDRRSVSSGRSR